MINSDDKVGDGMSDFEKVKDSAESYDKYFNDLGIFEECAICGYEGPRDGLIYLSTLSNDGKDLCISSGLQHLYQNFLSVFNVSDIIKVKSYIYVIFVLIMIDIMI